MTLTTFDLDQSDDSLPLIHPELINWEQTKFLDIPIFLDDDAIVNFLCSENPETSFTNEFHNEASN